MSETESPIISDEAKGKLADVFQEGAGYTTWDEVYYDRNLALHIVKKVIEAGWVPRDSPQPNGRLNFACSCGIRMEGPDNG